MGNTPSSTRPITRSSGLVIVKELFDPGRLACSRLVLSVFEETHVPCLLLDYAEFQELTFFRPGEESLVGTLKEMFATAREYGFFLRPRLWLRSGWADGYTRYRMLPPESGLHLRQRRGLATTAR